MQEERDYRGYDEDKGWAHAIAHGADALDDLAQCSELDQADLFTILDLVYDKITITERVYSDGEDERFRQKNNIKNFLKSLYFRVKFYKADAALCPVIEDTLYKVEQVYYC